MEHQNLGIYILKNTNTPLTTKMSTVLQDELSSMKDIVIFKVDNDSYELFNRYSVCLDSNGNCVVNVKNISNKKYFSSLRNAVTWCIYNNTNKFGEANRVEELDLMLCSMETAIKLHKNMIQKSKNTDASLIYAAKLSEEQLKYKTMKKEILAYIKQSKIWQDSKYARA